MATESSIKPKKQKFEYYYSIGVMVLIPILIVANTIFIINNVRDGYDRELRASADVFNNGLKVTIANDIEDDTAAQEIIDRIVDENEEILALSVAEPVESNESIGIPDFKVIASSDKEQVGQTIGGQLIPTLIEQPLEEGETRRAVSAEQQLGDVATWAVASTIEVDGEIIAVVITNFGFDRINEVVAAILNQSLFIMLGVIAVVLLLLLNHFRLVNYSILFKKLKEVDQLKNDFLSVATHELKSPMAVIKGSLENIKDGVFGATNEKMAETIDLALMETDRLSNLVTDLLNVSRIEQGRVTYKTEAVNLQEILLHLTNQYRRKAQEKNLTLTYEPTDRNYIVTADHGRILEIFTNLIDNAIKYSEKGEVVVSHQIEKDIVKTTVRDTGIGMSAKERDKLFSRFYRIQNQKTAHIAGTGLGLWIIKQYIEAMKGHIYVDSLEGVGSSFIVEFPLTAEKQAPGVPEQPAQKP